MPVRMSWNRRRTGGGGGGTGLLRDPPGPPFGELVAFCEPALCVLSVSHPCFRCCFGGVALHFFLVTARIGGCEGGKCFWGGHNAI